MTGSQRSMTTSEADAEYEEDDDISMTLHASNEHFTENHPPYGMPENERESGLDDNEATNSKNEMEYQPLQSPPESNRVKDQSVDYDVEYREGSGAIKMQPCRAADDHESAESQSDEFDSNSDISSADDVSKDSSEIEAGEQWIPEPEEEDEIPNPNSCM